MSKKKNTFLSKPLFWSSEMNQIFNSEVNAPVLNHPKSTTGNNNKLFGIPFKFVQNEVLQAGRADFTKTYSYTDDISLTKEQLVLLYCFVHMKQHFYSSYANFRLSKNRLLKLFHDHKRVNLIDIGCGPGTAGLAFAELFNSRFCYYGVDRSFAMRNKAKSMLKAGVKKGMVHAKALIDNKKSWTDLPKQFGKGSAVILNFSFFFSSSFLTSEDIDSLSEFYKSIQNALGTKNVLISYTNSIEDVACKNYKKFVTKLGLNYYDHPPKKRTVRYFKSWEKDKEGNEKFMREIYGIV